MSGLRGVTLTVRFLCELAMLAALAFWGFTAGEGLLAWVLGIGAPVLVAGVATSLLNEAQERQAGPGDLQRRRR
jgi:hypothetical protein